MRKNKLKSNKKLNLNMKTHKLVKVKRIIYYIVIISKSMITCNLLITIKLENCNKIYSIYLI